MPEDFSDLAQHGAMKGIWKEDGICRNVFPSQTGNRTSTYCEVPAPGRCPMYSPSTVLCLCARKMGRTILTPLPHSCLKFPLKVLIFVLALN